MSAAPLPRITPGFTPVPNSFIENSALLTDSERVFALVVMRRGPDQTISAGNWRKWTGLSERAREYAIKGLSQKGLLDIHGRGDRARFDFTRDRWESYVRTADPNVKPKTAGARKPVAPKTGALVHPECRELGCKYLRETQGENGLSGVVRTPIAQPVAQMPDPATDPRRVDYNQPAPVQPVQSSVQKTLIPLVATPIAQQVAQTAESFLLQWAKTLEALNVFFAVVGAFFLSKLVAQVRAVFPDATDDEIGQAVILAGKSKLGRQNSIALFLLTVPEAMHAVRKRRAPTRAAPVAPAAGFKRVLELGSARYREMDLGDEALACDQLIDRLKADDSYEVLNQATLEASDIMGQAAKKSAARLSNSERRLIHSEAEKKAQSNTGRFMTDAQLAELSEKLFLDELRNSIHLPDLSAWNL